LQQLHIFPVDKIDLFDAKPANLPALHPPWSTRHRAIVFTLESAVESPVESKITIFVI
jgi:hypothetical protein